jgi:hypothetical protein
MKSENKKKESNSNRKLRIGLIVDSTIASKYIYEIASWAREHSNLEIGALIIQNIETQSLGALQRGIKSFKKNGLIYLLQQVGYTFLLKFENILLKRNSIHSDHFKQFNLLDCIDKTVFVKPLVSQSGFVYRYSSEDVQKIKDHNIDVLIRCGSGILRGDILTSTKYGILSFHHADNRINRGGPPGFWEVYGKEDSTGFVIQQLTDELDGGQVLFRGCFATKYYYLLNQANLYRKSNFYLKKILSDLAESRNLPQSFESFPYFDRLYKRPNLKNQIFYFVNLMILILNKIILKFLLRKNFRWGVAFKFTNWKNLVMWKSVRIKNPKNHFLADPFVISKDDRTYCFVEDYDFKISQACISLYELKDTEAIAHGQVIVEPFHMSYPYVFEYQSRYYMVPETCEKRGIRLYVADHFPFKWKFLYTLIDNVDAADTTIFEKDGIWWLFTNIDPTNSSDHSSELFIYFSDSPLTQNWMPHPKNPIFCDSLRARMGGILFDEKLIYRVSQKQGFNMYGECLNINKIIQLSKTEYLEELQLTIKPNFFSGLRGTHHMHGNNHVTVFDFVEKTNLT